MEAISSAVGGEQKDRIWQILEQDPHRVFEAQGIAATIKPGVKDPQQQQQLLNEVKAGLLSLVEEGKVREVADGLFKAKLFTNAARHIEHAFIGGMGNTHFRFKSPVFRLNIGVLSIFFIKNRREQAWLVLVRDSTAGTSFCLTNRLKDGAYLLGSEPQGGEKGLEGRHGIRIMGRYIEKQHVSVILQGDEVSLEDQKTATGTRVDLLTEEGFMKYQEAAQDFLKGVEPSRYWDPVSRGRYVLDQFLRYKRDYETTFFSAAVDWVMLEKGLIA